MLVEICTVGVQTDGTVVQMCKTLKRIYTAGEKTDETIMQTHTTGVQIYKTAVGFFKVMDGF